MDAVVKIVIADDQRLMRDGLQTILQLEPDMQVVHVAEHGRDAYEAVGRLEPHLVLMDIKMPVMDGIEAMKLIKRDYPGVIVLMLTTFAEDKFIIDAMAGGADGFLLKDMTAEKVVQTVRDAMKGEIMLPASIAARLASRLSAFSGMAADALDEAKLKAANLSFTERERRIILLMIEGSSNKQIASALFMSEGTVRNYISIIYNKIGTSDRQAALVKLKALLLDGPS